MKARAEKLLAQVQKVKKLPTFPPAGKVAAVEMLIEDYARLLIEVAAQVEALTAIVACEQPHGVGHG